MCCVSLTSCGRFLWMYCQGRDCVMSGRHNTVPAHGGDRHRHGLRTSRSRNWAWCKIQSTANGTCYSRLSKERVRRSAAQLHGFPWYKNTSMNTSRKGYPCFVPMDGTHTPTSLSSGQARRVTAADIPPELYWNILRYVIRFKFDSNEYLPNDNLRRQLNCSLVCVYWAQEIRRSLYGKRIVWISTERQAKAFRKLVVHRGSERLTPIVDMIDHIDVQQDPDSRSWHHILLHLIPAIPPHKFRGLHVCGSSSVGPQSPHWGIPKRLPSFTTLYRRLNLRYLRFSSLHALVTLLRQFPRLEELNLNQLSWDDDDMHALAHLLPSTQRKHPLLSKIYLWRCGDIALLFLHLAQFRPYGHSLLKTLSDDDQGAVAEIISSVCVARVKHIYGVDLTVTALSGK